MIKFKKGDKVRILSGKDKGREGIIEKILIKERRALIPGVNIFKKHVKGQQGQKAGIYEIPRPLPLGKFALVCPKCKKATRVGIKIVGQEKTRVCQKCHRQLDVEKKGKK